jgi:hypothetical protein
MRVSAVATVLFAVAQLGSSRFDAKFLFANPQSCEADTPSGRRVTTLCTGLRYSFVSDAGQRLTETQARQSGVSVELRIASNGLACFDRPVSNTQ